jgi:hypothetical protein
VKRELSDRVTLFEETSDAYFERERPLEPLGGAPVSLAFIVGMHLAEYALRDFMNIERHADWTSVIVVHDVLPRRVVETARDRTTQGWTGDVYKLVGILARHRPDLIALRVGADPTGLLLVLGLDPSSDVLSERNDEIQAQIVVPDPQDVPAEILGRRRVLDPEQVLQASFWSVLRDARERDLPRSEGIARLRRAVRKDFGRRHAPTVRRLVPTLR